MEKNRVSPAVHAVGARMIVTPDFPALPNDQPLHQVTIVEWAPSGRFVNLRMDDSGKSAWYSVEAFHVVEVLGPTQTPKRDTKARQRRK